MIDRRECLLALAASLLAAAGGAAQPARAPSAWPVPAPQLRALTPEQLSKLIKASDGEHGIDATVSAEVATALKVTEKNETVPMRQLALAEGPRIHAVNRFAGDVAFLFGMVMDGEARVFRVEKDFRLAGAVSKKENQPPVRIDPAQAQTEAQREIDFWASIADRL
ncbi:MAG: hypothetical protein HY216_13865 [Candidatus Rokubacteria bacterium]|nr:hypothetical protein [Candidatus Rokubacteria bacterium]